jgi:ABC-type multidrug transport system fused ATPase/permease subunit
VSAKKKKSRKGGSIPQLFEVLRLLHPFLHSSSGRVGFAALLAVFLSLVEAGTLLLVGFTIDSILNPLRGIAPAPAPFFGKGLLLGLLVACALLRGALVARLRWLAGRIGERTAARLRDQLWEQLQYLPLDYVRTRGPGRLVPRFINDARAVQRLVTHGLAQLIQALSLIVATFAALVLLNPRMALAAGAVLPFVGFAFWRLMPRLHDESRAARRRSSTLNSHLHERLLGMATIKAFVQHSIESDNFTELNRDLARRGGRRALLASYFRGWSATGIALAGVAALALVGSETAAGRLTTGGLVAFYALLGLLLPAFLRIAAANDYFQDGQISLSRIIRILELDVEGPSTNKAPDLKVTDGEILVQNVSCQLDKKTILLPETTLRARRGALTAIVGPDGCGKTTLLELLVLFRSVSKGKILIDGQDITAISLKSLRSQVGLVSEDSPLFDGTIRANIAYGLPSDAPVDQLRKAAQLAGADQFIEKLPKGWDTRVGRGASRLSHGQRRQLALARAIAVNPPILLIDEPASALDPETEALFAQTLRTLSRTKTIIVTARRLPGSLLPDQQFTLPPNPGRKPRGAKENSGVRPSDDEESDEHFKEDED